MKTQVASSNPRRRLLLSLLAIFLLLSSTYLIVLVLLPSLALPVIVGLSTVTVIFLTHRWFANLSQQLQIHSVLLNQELQKQNAMINLTPLLRGVFVPFGQWAMEPVHLFNLLAHIQSTETNVLVECGAGASTLIIGNLLRQKGQGHIFSLEENLEWHRFMSRHIESQNLGSHVTLVHAPLEPYAINGEDLVEWYSMERAKEVLSQIDHIDVLIVDGPKSISALSRFPALPVFLPKINSDTLLILDDVNRSHEQAVLSEWQKLCALEIDLHREAERHQAYVRIRDAS